MPGTGRRVLVFPRRRGDILQRRRQNHNYRTFGNARARAKTALLPPTPGCFGLSVNGSNFRNVSSVRFATPITGGKARLLLDVYVPPNQPNQFFFGAVQTLMSCPAAGINNVFLGQVDLTGKPVGAFSTLSYNVPSNVQAALAGNTSACSFLIGVNTNATPTPPVLDNLRFSF